MERIAQLFDLEHLIHFASSVEEAQEIASNHKGDLISQSPFLIVLFATTDDAWHI